MYYGSTELEVNSLIVKLVTISIFDNNKSQVKRHKCPMVALKEPYVDMGEPLANST